MFRQSLGECLVLDDVAVLELGEDSLERAAESVEDADGVLQRCDALLVHSLFGVGASSQIRNGCGIVGVDQEGGAAIDSGLEQVDAVLGCRPAIDDEVIELFAKKLVDYAFMLAGDFKEVGERAHGRLAGTERAGLE